MRGRTRALRSRGARGARACGQSETHVELVDGALEADGVGRAVVAHARVHLDGAGVAVLAQVDDADVGVLVALREDVDRVERQEALDGPRARRVEADGEVAVKHHVVVVVVPVVAVGVAVEPQVALPEVPRVGRSDKGAVGPHRAGGLRSDVVRVARVLQVVAVLLEQLVPVAAHVRAARAQARDVARVEGQRDGRRQEGREGAERVRLGDVVHDGRDPVLRDSVRAIVAARLARRRPADRD